MSQSSGNFEKITRKDKGPKQKDYLKTKEKTKGLREMRKKGKKKTAWYDTVEQD